MELRRVSASCKILFRSGPHAKKYTTLNEDKTHFSKLNTSKLIINFLKLIHVTFLSIYSILIATLLN